MQKANDANEAGQWIITPYITKNGKRIYPKAKKFFRFWVPAKNLRS